MWWESICSAGRSRQRDRASAATAIAIATGVRRRKLRWAARFAKMPAWERKLVGDALAGVMSIEQHQK